MAPTHPRDQQRPFLFGWQDALLDSDLKPRAKLVGLAASTYADIDGRNVRPSIRLIAVRTGQGERTVRRALVELRVGGFLRRVHQAPAAERGGGGTDRYVLAIPAGPAATTTAGNDSTSGHHDRRAAATTTETSGHHDRLPTHRTTHPPTQDGGGVIPTDSTHARELREAQQDREPDSTDVLLADCLAARAKCNGDASHWTRGSITAALDYAVKHNLENAAALLVALADNPAVAAPGAIAHRTHVKEAQRVLRDVESEADRATWLPHCGQCDVNRQIEGPNGTVKRCSRCHPLVVRQDAA
jgi:hypothetical protein